MVKVIFVYIAVINAKAYFSLYNGQQWVTMGNNGQQWATMGNNEQQWARMAKQWARMGKNGQQWTTIRGATCISDAIFLFFDAFPVSAVSPRIPDFVDDSARASAVISPAAAAAEPASSSALFHARPHCW